jgi:hypothetical protein
MHPPFGFALFYLRSVAPTDDYRDRITGRMVPKVTTGQIYWGAVPFVIIQVVMVGLIIAFPGIVTRDAADPNAGNLDQLQQQIDRERGTGSQTPAAGGLPEADKGEPAPEDPMEAIRRANEQDKQKK